MSDTPELRPGPPWAMDEMIHAEPGLVEPVLGSEAVAALGELVRDARAAGEPVVLTGCGTSEHAAMAGAAMLGAVARDAFEASLDPQEGGVLIAISHEAGTTATLAAAAAARERGARVALITARPEHAPEGALVVATPLVDRSWCHTVGYLSPLLALAGAAGAAPGPAQAIVGGVMARRDTLHDAAAALDGCVRLLAVGSGVDEITARELALKIEEGVHVPTTPLGLEKLLHGHLPAADSRTGLVLLRLDPRRADERDRRAGDACAAAAALDMPTVLIGPDLPSPDGLDPIPGALLAGALAAQLLTAELVLAAGTNPDLIRREEEPYRLAAEAGKAG